MKLKSIIIAQLLLAAALPVWADTKPEFTDLVNRIADNNTELKATRLELDARKAESRTQLNLSDPEIEFSHKWGPAHAADKTEFGISQGFDWPGVYRHRRRAVAYEADALQQLWLSNIIDRKLEIKMVLLDMVYLNRQIGLVKRRLDAIDTLMVKYADPVNRTSLTRLDINKLKIERYRLSSKLNAAKAQKNATLQQLAALNGNADCSAAADISVFPDEPILSAADYAAQLEGSPELLASKAESQSLNARIKEEKAMRLPGFSIGYSYAREENMSFNGFSLGITLPLFSSRNKVKSATLQREAQIVKQQQMQFSAAAGAYASLIKVQSLKQTADEAQKLIGETDYSRLLGMALDGGQISLTEYLIESNYYLEFEEEYLDACYQFQCEAARLNKLTLK